MNYNLHAPVYIPSIEATDLYWHMHRDKEIELKYVGMIPSSLELNKLVETGLKTKKHAGTDKLISNDIINVKFAQKVKSGKEIISQIKKKIKSLSDDQEVYKKKLEEYIEMIESEKNQEKWRDLNNELLREKLYVDGFTITYSTKRSRNARVKYIVYKRSSAKSRIGECLFIREDLYYEMISWSQLNLDLSSSVIDVPSLLAYQSLVGSSLDSLIKINTENIFIVDDIDSKFIQNCNVVKKGSSGFLESIQEDIVVKNSLFDGESLLDSRYFPPHKGMLLLRNHMFKSAAFNCNIQKFLKDHCPENIPFELWEIEDMFGNKVKANKIHLIITPSSLKALKFSHVVGTEPDLYTYWKRYISKEHNYQYSLFGVVKSEKKSKHGYDQQGYVLQQTSYQMINCLPFDRGSIDSITAYEKNYISQLKNNDEFFIEHITKQENTMNSNAMFKALYDKNRNITKTKLFKDFRKSEISKHVTHVKNGKVRLRGDYCTMLGNPVEFLYHSIGRFDDSPPTLIENEIHTTLFDDSIELVGFRNPNTSPSNVLIAKNKYVDLITRYFNLTSNIVCVNAINFPLQDILSGSDYDSDTLLLVYDEALMHLAKLCYGNYKVCINKVNSSKKNYKLTGKDMAEIDNLLSLSQKNIGRVVNLGQLCMSRYWDNFNKTGKNSKVTSNQLLKYVDIMTVLSGICIDLAKKLYDIDIEKEVKRIAEDPELKVDKPMFWKYVSQSSSVKTKRYDCPMDFLFENMSNIEYATRIENIDFTKLLRKQAPIESRNRKQAARVLEKIDKLYTKVGRIYSTFSKPDERDREIDTLIRQYENYFSRIKIDSETIYLLLKNIDTKQSKIQTKLMNILFKTQGEDFLKVFQTA